MPRDDSYLPLRHNHVGKGIFLVTFALLMLGVVMVHSAVASVVDPGPWYLRKDVRHTIFAALALLILATTRLVNYRVLAWRIPVFGPPGSATHRSTSFLHEHVPFLPALGLAISIACGILVFVPGIGRQVGGAHRWIRIGPPGYGMGFQPSELIKISLLVFLAVWISDKSTDVRSFTRTLLPVGVLIAVCLVLVGVQDLGTGLIIAAVSAVTLFLASVPWYYLLGMLGLGAGGFSALLMITPHRLARIQAMIEPWSVTNPASYQPRQSLLAILTGGMTGKGLGRGMIKQGFLPEGETDFIFSVFFEECGFLGALVLVGLVLVWIWLVRKAALRASDDLGRVLVGSLGFLIGLQAVLHIAVDVVAAPPTGINFPFVSAGGTALLTSTLALAIILSVTARPRAESARTFVHRPLHIA